MATHRVAMEGLVTENDWKSRVVDAAKLFGWRYAHFRPAQTTKGWRTAMEGHKGFPDLVLVRGGRVIFAELKVNAPLSPEQSQWIADLGGVYGNVEVYVWRPDDWDDVYTTLAKQLVSPMAQPAATPQELATNGDSAAGTRIR